MRAPTGPEERGRTTYSSRRQSGLSTTGSSRHSASRTPSQAVPPPRPLSVRSTPRPRRAPSGPACSACSRRRPGASSWSPGAPPALRPQPERAQPPRPPCPGSGSRAAPRSGFGPQLRGLGKGRLRTAPLQPSSILSTGRRPARARDSSGRQRERSCRCS